MKKVTLPSGAELKISLAPFADGKALYQAVLSEMRGINLDPEAEVDVNLFKDLFCVSLASKKIEKALEKCLKRCLYNGKKITEETFESEEARGDYILVCTEVATENIVPFGKALIGKLSPILAKIKSTLKLEPKKEAATS